MAPLISSKCICITSHELGAHESRPRIPKALSEAFGPVFQDRDNVEEANVDAVVSAIDCNDETLCKRLDIKCLSIFCGILRLSAEIPSQLRGYCVLAVSTCSSRDLPALISARNFSIKIQTRSIHQNKT